MNALKFGAAAAFAVFALPVEAKEPPVTGMALQQIQAKDIEAPASVVFSSVMTVLQDAGFRILTADKDTGLITAQASTESKLTWNIWWGLGKKKEVPIVSAFVEQRGPNTTRARLNFVMSTGKSRNAFTDEKPMTDPTVYRDAFEKIEKEVFVRVAMNAPATSTPAAVSTAVTAPTVATPAAAVTQISATASPQ